METTAARTGRST